MLIKFVGSQVFVGSQEFLNSCVFLEFISAFYIQSEICKTLRRFSRFHTLLQVNSSVLRLTAAVELLLRKWGGWETSPETTSGLTSWSKKKGRTKVMMNDNARNAFILFPKFPLSTVVARLNNNFAALFVFRLSLNKTIYLLLKFMR